MVSKKEEKKRDFVIVQDSREQKGLFDKESIRLKLDVGDYSILGYTDKISIERKSPADLMGTLGKGHERFRRELQRAKSLEYFAIIVETNMTNILDKAFEGAKHSGMSGETALKILFTNHFKYGPAIYLVNGRKEAKKLIELIFTSYVNYKISKYDKIEKINEVA